MRHVAFCFQRHERPAAITASAKARGEFSRTLQSEASAIGQYLATLGLSAFDWRRQFGPALDQTIFGLERHDPLVMSGAAAILALVGAYARPSRASGFGSDAGTVIVRSRKL